MASLLSIEDISKKTGLEESLLRFYESEYPRELPEKHLRGDVLFFDPESVDIFKKIHARHVRGAKGARKAYGRVIAVTSGKGGVGKTNIALNLAIAFQHLGKTSVVLDADMGMANVHLLAGVNPEEDISAVVTSRRKISDIIIEGPEGIGIIPGGGGILALADSTRHERLQIVRALEEVEGTAEVIIVDTGAGMGPAVRDFLTSADELLFVLTPDITSLADAYGLLKSLHQQNEFGSRPVYVVINMIQSLTQAADVAVRFSSCAQKFLGITVETAGYIFKDATVGAASIRRQPYTVFRPHARVSKNTANLALNLIKNELPGIRASSAFSRFRNLIRAGAAGRGDNFSEAAAGRPVDQVV